MSVIMDYQVEWQQTFQSLSEREKALYEFKNPLTLAQAEQLIDYLESNGYVRVPGGQITLGLKQGLRCSIEGRRRNETKQRQVNSIPPFYIATTTVRNEQYEEFDSRHTRPAVAPGDKHPAVCLTYGRAISYCLWLNERLGSRLRLPTEPELVMAIAPEGWQYSYQEQGRPILKSENVYNSFPDCYPLGLAAATLEVDTELVKPNYLGLRHAGGNVSNYTLGHYYAPGHWGAVTDGAYTVVIGGNFRQCARGPRVVSRGLIDIAGVCETVGIRLVYPDPMLLVKP